MEEGEEEWEEMDEEEELEELEEVEEVEEDEVECGWLFSSDNSSHTSSVSRFSNECRVVDCFFFKSLTSLIRRGCTK